MDDLRSPAERDLRVRALKLGLLAVWAAVTFGAAYFARALDFVVFGWPFGYWFAAQGAILTFIAILVVYAWAMNRLAPEDAVPHGADDAA
jgi:putative solute:sodium symporter small subunit